MQWIAEALASVSGRERDLVAQIYGFDQSPVPVEEVAGQFGLSLLQTEQTVHKVLRRMRHPDHARLIREALISAGEVIWLAAAGQNGIIYQTESMAKIGARLPGELLFAIECQYGLLENWLSKNSRATPRAWYRSRFPEAEIDRLLLQLTAGAGACPLPFPVEALSGAMHCDLQALQTAVRLSGTCRNYSGYVAGLPLGTRAAGRAPAPHAFRHP